MAHNLLSSESMSVAKPNKDLLDSSVYHQRPSPISETRKILALEPHASMHPTQPVPSPFVAETSRPGEDANWELEQLSGSISEVTLRKASSARAREIEDLRGKLRLRRSLPPKF